MGLALRMTPVMENPSVLMPVAFSTLSLIVLYHFLIYPILLSPLKRIPNAHWSSSISPAWILYTRFKHRENRALSEAHRRLGPIVKVGPNEVSINDIGFVRTVYGGGFDKTKWYSVFDNFGYVSSPSWPYEEPSSAQLAIECHVCSQLRRHENTRCENA